MISFNNVAIQFAGYYLFEEVSFSFGEKDRIGLTGLNGTGKSTLMKMLIGELKPSNGNISIPNNISIGYLPQIINVEYNKTVFEETFTAFNDLIEIKDELKILEEKMATTEDYTSDEYTKILERYTSLNEKFQNLEGHQANEKLEKILKGLGFAQSDFKRKVAEMSGGWQMRIELAKLLLKQPNYILLDEPTNHLDIESIIWLEQFLKSYPGAVMLISHDKAFLDNITNRTVEIDLGKIYDYKANFSKYIELRKERKEKQEQAAKNQEKFIEHTQTLINKFRAKKNKAKFAQTLITKLDKLEKIEVDQSDSRAMNFRFPDPPRSGKIVLEAEQLGKSYGELEVLKNLNFVVEQGEKIAFVGKNGMGKTTLSKIICGKIDYSGKLKLGHNVVIGYFEQHQAENLDGNQTVFEIIDNVATGEMRTKVRALLGAFLFSGDDVDKKVKVLSGGEKSRLALAKLMLEPVNLLVLDEPTNHLDMRSKDLLKAALNHYSGTMIVVSHDREFLEGLTQKVYEFTNKNIKKHIGDVYEFLSSRNLDSLNELGMKNQNVLKTDDKQNAKKQRIEAREKNKEKEKQLRKLKKEVNLQERKIETLESEIKELEQKLADPDFYKDKAVFDETVAVYDLKKNELDALFEKWESTNSQIEKINA